MPNLLKLAEEEPLSCCLDNDASVMGLGRSSLIEMGLSRQPWGTPVPSVSVKEMGVPIHTACGREGQDPARQDVLTPR